MSSDQLMNQQKNVKSNISTNHIETGIFTTESNISVSSTQRKEVKGEPLKYAKLDSFTEMSQFRAEDMSSHSSNEVKSRDIHPNSSHSEPSVKSESQELAPHSSHSFITNQIRPDYSDDYIAKTISSEYQSNKQTVAEYSPKSSVEFSSSKQHESYHPKQLHNESERVHSSEIDDNYPVAKIDVRHGHSTSAPVPFSGQPRFLSGQSISQATGPTPTLNQLLQASSPVHRFHSYPSVGPEPYQQPWPIQRPSVVPPVYPQTGQRPPQTSSPRLHHGPGGPSSPSTLPYQSYGQRFSSPARSHSPYSHHQLNSYSVTTGHSSNLYGDQRNWSSTTSINVPVPSAPNQSNSSSQSPQRSLSQSPAPPPSASPQPQTSNQPQTFHGMQQRSTTPNAQGIDSGELSGQNSNDSSNGPAGPATPNSQGMRPTPSPTGSTGSRSMSPAVVQQSVQMPPRPSSSQSDGGNTTRVSLSPLATQASSDDPTFTPKVRKEVMGYHSHPATPQSTVPSPGAASINSVHEDYPDISSPGWPRTPASPVYNSHVAQDPYRSKKSDSLSKLYEMDDSIERRSWLDKLVAFMEDRRTPISSCPTISKNPLDLFRLYLYVKERGGFMEVTKNKTWKDIAGLLGIGASSSAAYTLRKHYTKHLLAFECYFDRGGVDPQPIINQVEAGSKKKASKSTSSIPSPGSSNSQDSFPAGGSNSTSVDSYGSYSSNYSGNTNSGPTSDYNPPPPRPPSQSSSSHQNIQQNNYQTSGSFQNYTPEQYNRAQGAVICQQNEFNPPYSSRSHYPSYVADVDRAYVSNNLAPNSPSQDIYTRYSGSQPGGSYSGGSPSGGRSTYSASQSHSSNVQQPLTSQQSSSQNPSAVGSTYTCSQEYYRQDQNSYASQLGSHSYTNTVTTSKSMPPPSSGPQQPRRHPDFVKEQPYSTYNQRTAYSGWSTNANQFGSNSIVRMPYPNQQSQAPQQQQTQQTQATTSAPIPSTISINNNQQWSSQSNTRSNPQMSVNTLLHSPSAWEHRYNQTTTLYTPTGPNQNQLGINTALSQQPIIKREISFPAESVEAVTPLSYKRRKLTRSDTAPVEAWRIMMALRSGLLAESCWALDVLNILLFDDSSVHYFGLTHLPGLLDVLLEHFSRSLSDMFDSSIIDVTRCYYQQSIQDSELDLGVVKSFDTEDRTKLLSTSNYTFMSRRGKAVKIIPRDDEIFILDNRRTWDFQDNEVEVESWQIDSNAISYIVTCFESEISNITNHLENKELVVLQKVYNCIHDEDKKSRKYDNQSEIKLSDGELSVDQKERNVDSKPQNYDKKKKLKTLSDVLSRIKREPIEMNELTRELSEKKQDGCKKNSDSHNKLTNNFTNHLNIHTLKTNDVTDSQTHHSLNTFIADSEKEKDMSLIHSHDVKNEEHSLNNKNQVDKNQEDSNNKKSSTEEEKEPKLKIRDPAGTLKRKRISDYEDESYSRDEASLYLITETQDNIARRCVCLSTILRNLTFIPGNEMEFSRSITFLSLLGKLLLLHHEHPTRAQKTRNYDREEDADFADSCSSLQGENEWWWDFLYHIRENVLVMAANIAGYMDLSQYPEEISRPVLDGLLHWAICPAAHGQDPFPTVNLNSSLSPQRLALEALCKLCVTESNVDLVVATPPYSRIQKLCSVLSRLLCRSEEQVLREFGVNLLHFLSAADSGVARTIALQTPCVALLVAFIEQAENSALGVANQHGIAALRDNPESMGTSLDMLRRAAGTLLNLSRHPDNRTLLLQHESRLLALVMSQILDQQVAAIVARVLFQCSRGST